MKNTKLPEIIPPEVIKDDAECAEIALRCGCLHLSDSVNAMHRHKSAPVFGIVQGKLNSKHLAIYYFAGYSEEKQNGWLVLVYKNELHAIMGTSRMLDYLHDVGACCKIEERPNRHAN